MHGVFIVAIVFGSIILALAIVGATILLAIKFRHGGLSREGQRHQAEEAGMIQELYNGISLLEERVEALETLLMDRGKDESI